MSDKNVRRYFPRLTALTERFRVLVYGLDENAPHTVSEVTARNARGRKDDLVDNVEMTAILRQGLSALPVPDISPDFDDRILQALKARPSRWQDLLLATRAGLPGAACALLVMLVLIRMTGSALQTADRMDTHTSPAMAAREESAGRAILAQFDSSFGAPVSRVEMLRSPRRPAPVSPAVVPPTPANPPNTSKRRSQSDEDVLIV